MEYRKIEELKKLDNNPRTITKEKMDKLVKSIRDNKDYFEARPLILSDRTGELVIIGGNQRYEASKIIGMKEVPTFLIKDLSEEREKEIIIRDNVNNGEWDFDLLANEWDEDSLNDWGLDFDFSVDDVDDDGLPIIDKPEVEFTEELMESHNYVILYFDNDIDWQTAVEKFSISSKKTPDSREGYERKGIGRVLKGSDILGRLE